MKRALLITLLLAITCGFLTAFRFVQWKPSISEDDRLKGSYRFEKNGWIFVHLEGSPEQIGYQHGKLLAKEIDDLLRVTRVFLQHETKRNWDFYRKAAHEILWPKIEPEYQRELDAIVKGANDGGVKADRWDIVALNALEELPYYYVPSLDKQQKGVERVCRTSVFRAEIDGLSIASECSIRRIPNDRIKAVFPFRLDRP